MEHVHFIGIGGSGLSSIATVLLQRGYTVTGSDRQNSSHLQRLSDAGAKIFLGHRPENVIGADLVVRSSAIPNDNIEVQAAISSGIPVLKRRDFLGTLIGRQKAIAIAGTHGKTTTTGMIATILYDLGLDPSFVVGGTIREMGVNARAGGGSYFVIEADEYDRMFLGLRPWIAVVTNIEHDHPDCYPTKEDFYLAFREFASRLEPGGVLIACGDDYGAARLVDEIEKDGHQVITYGLKRTESDYRATNLIQNNEGGFTFTLIRRDIEVLNNVALRVPGEHNVLNAVSALIVADVLGLPMEDVGKALGKFIGVGRRFELRGEVNDVAVYDDYAHHPTAIRATLRAARSRFLNRRIWAVWQPHTFSRTRTFFDEYLQSFDDADLVLVTEIFAARENAPEDHFSSSQIVDAMSKRSKSEPSKYLFAQDLPEAMDILIERLSPGDVVLVLSAGNADRISERLIEVLPDLGLDTDRKTCKQLRKTWRDEYV